MAVVGPISTVGRRLRQHARGEVAAPAVGAVPIAERQACDYYGAIPVNGDRLGIL